MCGCVFVSETAEATFSGPAGTNIHGAKGCKIRNPRAANGGKSCGIYAEAEPHHDIVPIDLDQLRHDMKAARDRMDSRAHAEREPWHAGIDPDDP